MPVKFNCTCGRSMNVKDSLAGKLVKCPACDTKVRVPYSSDTKARISLDVDSTEELDLPPELADVGQRSSSGSGPAYSSGTTKAKASGTRAKASGSSSAAADESVTLEDCPECGAEVKSTDLLCTSCGAELQVDTPDDPRRKLVVMVGLGAVLLVVVAVIGVVVFGGSSGEAEFIEGTALLERGQYQKAVTALEQAVEADEQRADFHFALSQALFGLGDWGDAQKAASKGIKVLKETESAGPFHLLIGHCHLKLGKPRKATASLSKAKGEDGVDPAQLAVLLGDALLLDEDPIGAEEQYEQAMNSDFKADALCGKGRVALYDDDYEAARPLLEAAIDLDDGHFTALKAMAGLCLATDALEEAADFALRAAEVEELDAESWLLAGQALYRLERYRDARAALESGMEADDEDARILGELVKVHIALGKDDAKSYDTALELVERALALDANPELHLSLGRVLVLSGKKEEALASLKESGLVEARVEMGKIYFDNAEFDEALSHFENARKNSNLVEPRVYLGRIYFQRSDPLRAIEVLEEARLNTDEPGATLLMTLGKAYAQNGQHDAAESVFTRLTDQQPQHIEGLYARAQAQFNQRRYDACIATLEGLLAIDASHKDAQSLKRSAELERFRED